MDTNSNQGNAPALSAQLRASNELVRLMVKLRWMRLEDEADCIGKQVASLTVPVAYSVCAAPRETD